MCRSITASKLVQMGVMKPTDQDQAEMAAAGEQAQQPSPQEVALIRRRQCANPARSCSRTGNEADAIEAAARTEKLKAEKLSRPFSEVENSQRDVL